MPKKQPLDFAPFVLRGDAVQAAQISAPWFADGAPKLPATVKIKRALRRVAIGLGETEVTAGHGDWLILTSESTPVLMSDRDFRMLFRPALEQAPVTSDQPSGPKLSAEAEHLLDCVEELLEVANLRGDNDLPHPADDTKRWTARMASAWDETEQAASSLRLSVSPSLPASSSTDAPAMEQTLDVLGLDDGTLCITGPEYPDVIAELPYAGAAFESKQREYAWLFAAATDLLAAAKLAIDSLSTNNWHNGSHAALVNAVAKSSPPDSPLATRDLAPSPEATP